MDHGVYKEATMMFKQYKEEFIKKFNKLCYSSKSHFEVWQDMITMFAISISNGVGNLLKNDQKRLELWNEREERYLSIIKKYSKKEQMMFPEMLALLVMHYEEYGFCDLLGEIYMLLEIGRKNKGQFFTPYDVSLMMANITLEKKMLSKTVKEKGFASINDSACGAGSTLIACVDLCQNKLFKKHNWQNHIYCVGQDIDEITAFMCYIQLSLLGIPGYVCIGDTLIEPVVTDAKRIYYTPLWFSNIWVARRMSHKI